MYSQFPSTTVVQPTLSGNTVSMELSTAIQVAPIRVENMLTNLGWMVIGTDPDTSEPLFQKSNAAMGSDFDQDLSTRYWRWYEAVAYEFANFINIGMDK